MDLKEYHGKIFPNSRDSFCYLFELSECFRVLIFNKFYIVREYV
jgi:hypothetical protein